MDYANSITVVELVY